MKVDKRKGEKKREKNERDKGGKHVSNNTREGWNSNEQNVKCTIGDKYGHVDDIVTQMNCQW